MKDSQVVSPDQKQENNLVQTTNNKEEYDFDQYQQDVETVENLEIENMDIKSIGMFDDNRQLIDPIEYSDH